MGHPRPLRAPHPLPRDRRPHRREGGFRFPLPLRHFLNSPSVLVPQTAAALKTGIKVIFCVGENLEERETSKTTEVVTRQLEAANKVLSEADWA